MATALSPLALDQEGPTPSELSASSRSVMALWFAIPGGRASPAGIATSDPALVLCIALPRSRAPPAGLATATTPAMASSLGRADPASPEDTASADAVVTLWSAIPRGRASPTGTSAAEAASSVVSLSGPRRPSFTRNCKFDHNIRHIHQLFCHLRHRQLDGLLHRLRLD